MIEERYIASLWYTSDVQTVRPDLSEEEAFEVLQLMKKRHDCNIGYNWDFVEFCASELFGNFDLEQWELEHEGEEEEYEK